MPPLPRLLAAAVAGVLMSTMVAPYNFAFLHWFGFAPMFWALREDTAKQNRNLAIVFGVVAEGLIFSWIARTIILFSNIPAPLAWGVDGLFALVYGLPLVFTWMSVHPLRRRLGDGWMLAFPAANVLIDWLAQFVILFPYTHGVIQHRTPYVWQLASITGAWGVTFLVMFVNAVIAEGIYRHREGRPAPTRWVAAAAAVLAVVLAYGKTRYDRIDAELAAAPVIKVAQLQTDKDMLYRMSHTAREAFEFWVQQTETVRDVDMVVWAEGASPFDLNDGGAASRLLWDLARAVDADLVVGGGTRRRAPDAAMGEDKVHSFNSVYVFKKDDPGKRRREDDTEARARALLAAGCDPETVRDPANAAGLGAALLLPSAPPADPASPPSAPSPEAMACVAKLQARARALMEGFKDVPQRFWEELARDPQALGSVARVLASVPTVETMSYKDDKYGAVLKLQRAGCADQDCLAATVACPPKGTDGVCAAYPAPPSYDKIVPVPFGEYLPFAQTFPWLGDLIKGPGHFRAGTAPVVFQGTKASFSTPICYEAILPRLCATYENPDMLVNVTNDAWFGPTQATDLHGMLAATRAMELGRPLWRSAYSGRSFVVEPHGRIYAETELFTEVNRVVEVRKAAFPTFYARFGDWFVVVCAAGLAGALALGARRTA